MAKYNLQAIEDNDFAGTEEQIFLYVYRAFAIEYHKKQEALEMEKFLFSKRPSLINANGFESPFTGMHLSISDLIKISSWRTSENMPHWRRHRLAQ